MYLFPFLVIFRSPVISTHQYFRGSFGTGRLFNGVFLAWTRLFLVWHPKHELIYSLLLHTYAATTVYMRLWAWSCPTQNVHSVFVKIQERPLSSLLAQLIVWLLPLLCLFIYFEGKGNDKGHRLLLHIDLESTVFVSCVCHHWELFHLQICNYRSNFIFVSVLSLNVDNKSRFVIPSVLALSVVLSSSSSICVTFSSSSGTTRMFIFAMTTVWSSVCPMVTNSFVTQNSSSVSSVFFLVNMVFYLMNLPLRSLNSSYVLR